MKVKISLVVAAAAVAFGFFLLSNSEGETRAQYPLDQFFQVLQENPSQVENKTMTLFGYVKEGSIVKEGAQARFVVKTNTNELNVFFPAEKGLLPDTFEDGSEVTVDGTYDAAQNTFIADKVLAKCASHYEPPNQDI